MKRRPLAIPDALWASVQLAAHRKGIPAAELVRRWLTDAVALDGAK